MRGLPVFFSLLAGVSAIDIWLNWSNTNCNGGNSIHCKGLNPNTCCAVLGQSGNPFNSIDVREIPSSWNIAARGFNGPQCRSVKESTTSNGRRNICLSAGRPYGGGNYQFFNGRSATPDEECTETVRPSIVSFADGTQYNVTDLDDASFTEIIEIAASGGESTDVPEKFNTNIMEYTL